MAITKQAIYTIDKYPNYQFTSEKEALETEELLDAIQNKHYLQAYQTDPNDGCLVHRCRKFNRFCQPSQ